MIPINTNSEIKSFSPAITARISLPMTNGRLEIIPTIIIREIPLPIPLSVIRSPIHISRIVPVTILIIAVKTKRGPGFTTTWSSFSRKTVTPYDCIVAIKTVPYLVICVIFFLPASPSFCSL